MFLTEALLLLLIVLALEGLLLGAHALRGRFGLVPFAHLNAVLVYFLMLADPLQPRLAGQLGLHLPIGSVSVFPLILFALLLVHVTEGPRALGVLFVSTLLVYALVVATRWHMAQWLRWQAIGAVTLDVPIPPELVAPGVLACVRSAVAMGLDVIAMVALLSLLRYGLPQLPLWVAFGLALLAGLIIDALAFPMLTLNLRTIITDVPGALLGKASTAVAMTLPMIFYLGRRPVRSQAASA